MSSGALCFRSGTALFLCGPDMSNRLLPLCSMKDCRRECFSVLFAWQRIGSVLSSAGRLQLVYCRARLMRRLRGAYAFFSQVLPPAFYMRKVVLFRESSKLLGDYIPVFFWCCSLPIVDGMLLFFRACMYRSVLEPGL